MIKLLKIMKKQKICIVGDGMSGLITAQILGKLDVQIDLISKKSKNKFIDNRTTALSPSNYKFISKHLPKKISQIFFECKKVSLYHEKENNILLNFLNFEETKKNLMLITENKNLKNFLISAIRKNKKIKIINKDVKRISINKTSIEFKNRDNYYDMILICVGRSHRLVEELLGKRYIEQNKKEIAFTCTVSHNLILKGSKQYFFKEGPMAILPISNKKFSVVWSMKKSYSKYNQAQIKKLILVKLSNILPKKCKVKVSKIKNFPIFFRINKIFFKNNIFALGESVYNVFPLAGQGFNLVLRDIEELYEKIKEYISLGIQIKDSLIFNNLYANRKPENFLYGLGIDLTQKFFRYNMITAPFKNSLLKDLDNFKFLKKIGLKIADKGIINN